MKKRGLLVVFGLLILLTNFILISAEINSSEETIKVNKAYSCLTNKTSGKCASLTNDEKIFTSMAIGQCSTELFAASSNSGECWPSSACTVKQTAQALLATDRTGTNTKAQNWIYSRNATPTDLVWYLQIETTEPSSCRITYSTQTYTITTTEDKKLSGNAGNCLVLSDDDYWLRISPSCQSNEFSVSCDKDFITNTIFRKSTGSTIYVTDETSSSSAGGTTKEKVNSQCFKGSSGTACDYEGTLWAALVLDSYRKDVSAYLPYLITMADDNARFLPDSFLYLLTGADEYKTDLLSKQKSNQWWAESGDRYFDTALAMYSLQNDNSPGKLNAKEWLLTTQDSNGCWDGNIKNTGFILASVWPKTISGGTGSTTTPSCTSNGYFCTSSAAACGGEILSQYSCPGSIQKCCSVEEVQQTCLELGGEKCSTDEDCIGGTFVDSADSPSCCVDDGVCQVPVAEEESECEIEGGSCYSSCNGDEEANYGYSCTSDSEVCCLPQSGGTGSYWWIWVLIILIVLVVLAIIFRDRLRMFWYRISSGKRPSSPPPGPSHYYSPTHTTHRVVERRIMMPQHHPQPQHRPYKSNRELDDVLKKLKELGK